jgi:hypothetical protein
VNFPRLDWTPKPGKNVLRRVTMSHLRRSHVPLAKGQDFQGRRVRPNSWDSTRFSH